MDSGIDIQDLLTRLKTAVGQLFPKNDNPPNTNTANPAPDNRPAFAPDADTAPSISMKIERPQNIQTEPIGTPKDPREIYFKIVFIAFAVIIGLIIVIILISTITTMLTSASLARHLNLLTLY